MDGRTRRLWLRGGQTGAYNEWAKRCQHFVQDDDVVLVVLVIAVVVVAAAAAAVHCWLSLFHIALLIVVAFVVVRPSVYEVPGYLHVAFERGALLIIESSSIFARFA